jgi:hypothetical protein
MDRRFSECNLKSRRQGFEIAHPARKMVADADSAGRSGIPSRAALYARPWPEVARGPRTSARNAQMIEGLGPRGECNVLPCFLPSFP